MSPGRWRPLPHEILKVRNVEGKTVPTVQYSQVWVTKMHRIGIVMRDLGVRLRIC